VEVEVERDELDRLLVERVPRLAAQGVAQDRLEVALVGVFEDEGRAGGQDRPNLVQRGGHVGHVVDDALHHRRVTASIGQWQVVNVGGDVHVAPAVPQVCLSFAQHGARVVEHDHLLERAQLAGHAPETRAEVGDTPPATRQQPAQRRALGQVFIRASATFPEVGAVARSFVVADGGRVVHRCLPSGSAGAGMGAGHAVTRPS